MIVQELGLVMGLEDIRFMREPDWKSPLHIARIILIANSLQKTGDCENLLPFYFDKHLNYLTQIYP